MYLILMMTLLGQVPEITTAYDARNDLSVADTDKPPPLWRVALQEDVPAGTPILVFIGSDARKQHPGAMAWDARQRKNGLVIIYMPTGWNNLANGSHYWRSDDGRTMRPVTDEKEKIQCVMRGEGITLAELHTFREAAIAWNNKYGWPLGDHEVAIMSAALNMILADRYPQPPRTGLEP